MIPQAKRSSALSPVSSDAIFVSYNPTHNAYRCYVPNLEDMIISNNVKFHDNFFPCLKSPTILNEDSSESPPSNTFFGSSAHGAYLPSSIVSISTSLYGPRSIAILDETISAVPSPRSLTVPDSSVSDINIPSSSDDFVASV